MSSTSDTSSWDTNTSYVGYVKWFNNKAGYGFLTVMDGDKKDEDVFCHHSGIVVAAEQYKYLVQGEYVSFSLRESDSEAHPYQANNITGVYSGKLMCETRVENRQTREDDEGGDYKQKQSNRRYRPRGGGPREDGATWMLVRTDENSRNSEDNYRRRGGNRRQHRDTRD